MSAKPIQSEERTKAIEILKEHGYEIDNLSSGLVMHKTGSLSTFISDEGIYFGIPPSPTTAWVLFFDFKWSSEKLQPLLEYYLK